MMKLSELLKHLPGIVEWLGQDVTLHGIRADSRRVGPGDLFVAVPGLHVDGHLFVGQAVASGAVAVVGERPVDEVGGEPGADFVYVRVSDARAAWAWASAIWEGFPSRDLTLIGVTGTDGKTTTATLVHALLQSAGIRAGIVTTVGALIPANVSDKDLAADIHRDCEEMETGLHTTTPDPPQVQRYLSMMVERGATHAVLEVTSHGLAQRRVAGCDFDVAVVTNVTHEHLDYHGSVGAYQQAKAMLFESLEGAFRKPGVPKLAVLNRDDDSFLYLSDYASDRKLTYSLQQEADVTASGIRFHPEETLFDLCTPVGSVRIKTGLVGSYNVSNILAAAAVAVGLGVSLEAVAEGVASTAGVPGRMERVDEGQPFVAIVDFAHTPNALTEALKVARTMVDPEGRVIVVFGSAGLRDRAKRRLMGQTAADLADVVIITAEDPRTESLRMIMAESAGAAQEQGKRLGKDLHLVADRGRAILQACALARPGDLVIACGKGHEQSMCFGTTEYRWDDREAMRLALRGTTLNTLPTAKQHDLD